LGFFTGVKYCMRIRCYTLFDITKTGVANRKTPLNGTPEKIVEWERNRNTQSNLDTIMQVISLRSQPEYIATPIKSVVNFKSFNNYGFVFDDEEDQPHWTFDFSIMHGSVFNDELTELGYLFSDCDGVPMIKVNTEWEKLPNFIDTTPELQNIYFEVLSHE